MKLLLIFLLLCCNALSAQLPYNLEESQDSLLLIHGCALSVAKYRDYDHKSYQVFLNPVTDLIFIVQRQKDGKFRRRYINMIR